MIKHGIYQKIFVLFTWKRLSSVNSLGSVIKVNLYSLNLPKEMKSEDMREREQAIKDLRFKLEDILGIDFRVKPYWYDYGSLLDAVKIEKFTIGLILQIIVVVSIFNVFPLLPFSMKKKREKSSFSGSWYELHGKVVGKLDDFSVGFLLFVLTVFVEMFRLPTPVSFQF